ncbi:PH domain-containing protein [Kribbella sp. NPDC004138]
MDDKPPDEAAQETVREEQAWGNNRWTRIFLGLPFLGATLVTVIDSANWPIREMWPALLAFGIMTVTVTRPTVRITAHELVIRYPIGGRRIARAEVVSARFNYFGLVIQLRDGSTAFAFLAPKLTSTELSSGWQPEPGGAAYEITRWAEEARS